MDEQRRDGLAFSIALGKIALDKDECKCWEGVLSRTGKQDAIRRSVVEQQTPYKQGRPTQQA